jgi:hypothetical protein
MCIGAVSLETIALDKEIIADDILIGVLQKL